MAYSPPTAADIKVRFPGFATTPDTVINAVLSEAIAQVGESWIESDRNPAQMYLTAHLLTTEGWPAKSGAASMENAAQGPVKRVKVGDVETEFAGSGAAAGGSSGSGAGYGSTEYGRRYLTLLKRSFPTPMVV